jgi:flagellin-like hook-associated protein FlgL
LLSLQSTADLLATTQNRLATGKKVNTALDNPTNYFTASALDSRASDINNLLDGIGNGVQVLQAANTGITSLQKLVDSAKSVASQALQTTVGYSAKSSVSVSINGATADNILGTGPGIDSTITGSAVSNNQLPHYTANAGVLGGAVTADHNSQYGNTAYALGSALHIGTGGVAASSGTVLNTLTNGASATLTGPQAGDTFTVNGTLVSFHTGGGNTGTALAGTLNLDITSATVGDVLTAIDTITGATGPNAASISGTGQIQLNTGIAADLTLANGTGTPLAELGLGSTPVTRVPPVHSTPFITASTKLAGAAAPGGTDSLVSGLTASDSLVVNNKVITFHAGNGNTGSVATNDLSIGLGNGTIQDVLDAIKLAAGAGSDATVDGTGHISLTTGTAADIDFTGSSTGGLSKLGLNGFTGNKVLRNSAGGATAIVGTTTLSGTATTSSTALTTAFAANDTITVNGQNITFKASGASGNNEINITDNVTQLLQKIDALAGAAPGSSTISPGGAITLHTGTTSDLNITSSNTAAFAALGFGTPVSKVRDSGPSALNGLTLDIASTGGGVATHLTFGSAPGQVKSLNDLNNQLASNNLQATLSQDGTLSITTSNDAASATIGIISGSSALSGQLFFNKAGSVPVADAAATAQRNDLVNQYNNILDQITTTAQDASFNGVNLLGGDTLKLTFNETGKSTLSIHGVNFNAAGLGLANLNAGDFKDNESVQKVVSGLGTASSTLRAQASAFGSNLSIVQIRQDFSKNLINVLQTGSSNLTLADTNEEAANSQALSTRQSIAVSALALANQSQQSVLQLLR